MRCIVFDCDNTIFATLPLHWEKHVVACARVGITLDPEWQTYIYQHNSRQNWQWLHDHHGLKIGMVDYLMEIDAWYLARAHTAAIRDGVLQVLDLAREQDIPLAVASSGRRITVEGMLRAHNLFDRFDVVLTGDDVVRTKPDPELYQTAFAQLEKKHGKPVDRDFSVAIEDDPLGVKSARTAGLKVIHRRLSIHQNWAEDATFHADTGDELVAAVRTALAL